MSSATTTTDAPRPVNGSHESEFGKWVQEHTDFSQQHAQRIASAREIRLLLEPIGSRRLPDTEHHCRLLSPIPRDSLPTVWQSIVAEAESEGERRREGGQ